MRFAAILFVLGACMAAGLAGSQSQPAQEQFPTFRSRVDLIEVEVRVTDRNGEPVRGLTKEDFTILDDDVPQTIATASFVDMAVESPVSRRTSTDVEPDVVTNAGTGRMWVLLLSGFGERARYVARQFVNGSLGPNDNVAVIHVNGTMSSAQGFTRNRLLMLNAIDRLQVAPPEDLPDVVSAPIDGTSRSAFMVLEDVCRRLALVTGRRKSVIFFDPPAIWIPAFNDVGAFFDQRDAVRCASRHNIPVYVVDTDGMSTTLGNLTDLAAQRAIAEDTGGDAIVNSNNFEGGYARFVRESSAYYLLGYVPAVDHRDGKFHNLKVRVNRTDVTVRSRRGYYALENTAGAPVPAAPPPEEPHLSAAALDALDMPLPLSGVTIDLSAAPFRGTNGNASVLLTARVRGEDLTLEAGRQVEVGYLATTNDGKVAPGAFHVFKLDLLEGSRTAAASAGLRLVDWLTLPRGRHQVRLVVNQPGGKTGLVVGDIEVPDFAGAPLSMSGVVIASEDSGGSPTMKTDQALEKMLRARPTAERMFRRLDVLTAYAEVYTNAKTQLGGVTATITRTGQLSRPRTIETSMAVAEPGRIGSVARASLRDFQAGSYVLTFEARAGNHSATRKVPFTIIN